MTSMRNDERRQFGRRESRLEAMVAGRGMDPTALDNPGAEPQHVVLPLDMVVRGSTALRRAR